MSRFRATPHRPRKLPTQERSRASYEAILQATLMLLEDSDTWGVSTNRVAGRAGVSVGSLYQYFPSKEAIVATLVERLVRAMRDQVNARLGEGEDTAALLIAAAIRAFVEERRRWHPAGTLLTRAIPWLGVEARVIELADSVRPLLLARLSTFRAELRPPDVDVASFIAVHGVHGAYRAMEILHPEWLFDDGFMREVVALNTRYLLRDPPELPRLPGASDVGDEPHAGAPPKTPPSGRGPRRAKARERVRIILRTTSGLIQDAPVQALSMTRVAEAAGVGVGTLYRYFPSKERLIAALIDRRWDSAFGAAEDALSAAGTLPERLAAMVSALLTSLRREPEAGARLTAACSWLGMEGEILARARRLERALAAALCEDAGARATREPAWAAFVLVHALHGTVRATELARPELLLADSYRRELAALASRFVPGGEKPEG